MTSAVTTHVLDTALGRPAAGVGVRLEAAADDGWRPLAEAATDDGGRVPDIGPAALPAGVYRLVFDTGGYLGPDAFLPEAAVAFRITDPGAHYHVPLLLSPFAFSTYRGS
jgi:5-hydroxyisourate hydrolase